MVETDALMKAFDKIAEEELPVKLINAYRGLPINYEAKIISISQGYVAFSVHEYQATCMALEGKTYLQSELLPEVVLARAVAVDVLKKQAILTEFVGVGHSVGNRLVTRVQPKEPTDVEIYEGDIRIAAKLADISPIGVGVFTFATYIYGNLNFEKGKEVFIDVRMPLTDEIVRFKGIITSVVHQKGTFLHRLGLKILPTPEAEEILRQYTTHRQEEVLRELQAIYNSMYMDREKKA